MGAHMEPQTAARPMSLSERADELEERMMHELNAKIATKSVLFNLADGNREMVGGAALHAQNPGKYFLMGADPRLPTLPDKPTLLDFLKYRFVSGSTNHLLQSATLALKAGHGEKVVLASFAAITATGARSSLNPMWTRKSAGPCACTRRCAFFLTSRWATSIRTCT